MRGRGSQVVVGKQVSAQGSLAYVQSVTAADTEISQEQWSSKKTEVGARVQSAGLRRATHGG